MMRLIFAGVLSILLTGGVMGGEGEGAGAAEAQRVRVLCYNIRHGRGMDGVVDLGRIAEVIERTEPDVVALQEVDKETERTEGVDQAAELGRLTGMEAVFGRAIDYAGGEYGNAILSRWPIVEAENHPLPHTEGLEGRAALAARIEGEGVGRFTLITTHLQHNSAEDRLAQARRINELFADSGEDEDGGDGAAGEGVEPMILAGDVNAVPESPPMEEFGERWVDSAVDSPEPTIPADEPRRRIDYILYRPAERWRVVEVYVVDEPMASDHRPVFAVLERVE